MAFVPITSAEISAGEPTRQELFTKIKDNEIDHEARIVTVEGAVNAFNPINFNFNGPYGILGTKTNVSGIERITFSLTVAAVRLITTNVGSSGSTEIDILFKRGVAAFTSILTTRASVPSSAGDFGISVDAVLDGTLKLLQAGDLIRCDLTASQGGEPRSFLVAVEYDKT